MEIFHHISSRDLKVTLTGFFRHALVSPQTNMAVNFFPIFKKYASLFTPDELIQFALEVTTCQVSGARWNNPDKPQWLEFRDWAYDLAKMLKDQHIRK